MNIKDLVTPRVISEVWKNAPSNGIAYLGAALFPQTHIDTTDLAWYKGAQGVTPVLKASAYDAMATYRDRIGVTKIETEVPYFKEAYKVTEKDMIAIKNAQSNGDVYLKQAIRNIYNDQANLIASAYVNPERMIFQLLAPVNGDMKIVMGSNDQDYIYNFDPNGTWKAANYAASTVAWGSATSTPIADLKALKKKVEKATGTKLTKLVMNSTTLELAMNSDEVKNYILTQNLVANILIDEDVVKSVLEKALKVTVIVYDKLYKDEAGATKNFMPDNYATFLPEGALGKTFFAVTPEEIEGGEGFHLVDGKIGCRVIHAVGDPVGTKTVVCESVLPSFERMDEVAVLKVK